MEEKKVLKKVKPVRIIIICALCAFLAGFVICNIALAVNDFNFKKIFSGGNYEEFVKDIKLSDNATINIDIKTDDIKISTSDVENARIKYYNSAVNTYELVSSENYVGLSMKERKFNWFMCFGSWDTAVEVILPNSYFGSIDIKCSTGNIDINNVKATSIAVMQSTGKTRLYDTLSDKLDLRASTGDIVLENVSPNTQNGTFSIQTSTGKIKLLNTKINSAFTKAKTGDIVFENVESNSKSGTLKIQTTTGKIKLLNTKTNTVFATATTGDIKLERLVSDNIELNTSTGNVSGTILGEKTEYNITVETKTGKSSLNNQVGDKKTLKVKTTTGDAKISFVL